MILNRHDEAMGNILLKYRNKYVRNGSKCHHELVTAAEHVFFFFCETRAHDSEATHAYIYANFSLSSPAVSEALSRFGFRTWRTEHRIYYDSNL
jgi:hypothetical protein